MANNNFLVYMYMRKDGTPYYVGKGRPNRLYDPCGKACPTPPKDRIVIYQEKLDEKTAFSLERELIAKYGRKDIGTGILRNLSDGGEESSGRKLSREAIEKISGKNHYNYVPRDWYHPDYGELIGLSCPELIKMFPECNLTPSGLCFLAKKKVYLNAKVG